jgi:hypothetical protein
MFFEKKGKVLKIKTGYNPNSSSIGTNLTPLIILSSVIVIVIPAVSFFLSRWFRKRKNLDQTSIENESETN